ncbi:MAG: hypothetical protein HN474_06945 [Nitrospina sp.]|jgi:hypothetical protein|nr:hypothetical protein [Nitrospina sp.]
MDQDINSKLITSYLPNGTGVPLIKSLKEETGICTGNVNNSRGTGTTSGTDFDSWVEIDVLEVVVDAERADEIFSFIYDKAGIGEGNSGFIIQSSLVRSTKFSLPDIPKEDW